MKLSLNGLLGYLQGKGWNVKMNADADEDEVFDIEEKKKDEEETEEEKKKREAAEYATKAKKNSEEESLSDDDILSVEELNVMKNLARALVKNSALVSAIQTGTLDQALTTVPAAALLVQNAVAQEKVEKDRLIAVIKQNNSNIYSDEELEALPNPILVKLNAQMNVSYAGMGGGFVSQNAEQPLVPPSMLLRQAEVSNGS